MKIFHILLGYLVVAAPFNQVAFASPAGVPVVGHDGDSNVLQQRSDALMKRDPGEIVETRQGAGWAGLAPTALVIIGIVAVVALSVIWVEGDNPVREMRRSFGILDLNYVSETCEIYPRHHQKSQPAVSKVQLDRLPPTLHRWVRRY